MADEPKPSYPKEDIPTNYLLVKTKSRVPWGIITTVAVLASIAGGLLWWFVLRGA